MAFSFFNQQGLSRELKTHAIKQFVHNTKSNLIHKKTPSLYPRNGVIVSIAYTLSLFKVKATILRSYVYISKLNKNVKDFKELGIIPKLKQISIK